MKVRLTGTDKEFAKLNPDTLDRNQFVTFRKPQKGNNPRYKKGGDKYDESVGEQSLMYVEIDIKTLVKMFSSLRLIEAKKVVKTRKTVKK